MDGPVDLPPTPPGWFPDPLGRHEHRWFNGTSWTADVADGGVRFVDPLGATPAPAADAGGRNGLATAALTLGIIGVTVAWMPFVVVIGLVLGVLALVFGIRGLGRARHTGTGRAFAITGIVTGTIALLLSIVGVVLTVVVYREVAAFIEPGPHDVELTSCTVTDGTLVLQGELTNLDDESHDYTVYGVVRRPRRVADLVVDVTGVDPGETVPVELRRSLRGESSSDDPGACEARLEALGPLPFGVPLDRIE